MTLKQKAEDIIQQKFEKELDATIKQHLDDLKSIFQQLGIPFTKETVIAYFTGILRAISYDTYCFVVCRPIAWEEFEQIKIKKKALILKKAEEAIKGCQ